MNIFDNENKILEKCAHQNKTFNIRNVQNSETQTNDFPFNNKTVNQAKLTRNIINYKYSNNSTSDTNSQKSYTNSTNYDFNNINKDSSYLIPLINKTTYTFSETNKLSNNSLIKKKKNFINCSFKFQNLNDSIILKTENKNIGSYSGNKKINLIKKMPKIIQSKRNEQFQVHACKNNINDDEDKLIIENINDIDNGDKYPIISNTKSKLGDVINPYILNHNVFFGKSFLDTNSWNNKLLKNILPENIDTSSNLEKTKKINKSERTAKKSINLENFTKYNGSFFNSKMSRFFISLSPKNNLFKENSKINHNMNNNLTKAIKNISGNVSNNNNSLKNLSHRIINQGNSRPIKVLSFTKIVNDNINIKKFKKLKCSRDLHLYSLYNKKMHN